MRFMLIHNRQEYELVTLCKGYTDCFFFLNCYLSFFGLLGGGLASFCFVIFGGSYSFYLLGNFCFVFGLERKRRHEVGWVGRYGISRRN